MKKEKVTLKLSELKAPERNIRRHPEKQIKEMIRSLNLFGQFRDVVVDENNVILAGNGLVLAMREAGWEEADVTKYYDLTENQKKKLMIADNQTASLGVDDYAAIEEILKSLDGDWDVPGYDENAIKMLCEETEAVVASVQSYGVYNQEDTDRVNAEADKREENGFVPVPQTYDAREEMDSPAYEVPARTAPMNENMEVTATQKFVVCPHCGEKIYL